MLLLRLEASYLLRIAERQFLPLLFHEPPRSTRFTSLFESLPMFIISLTPGGVLGFFVANLDYRFVR